MRVLVTSASGANGDGYGALLSFALDGTPLGRFSDDPRIADPRGLSVSPDRQHLYVNSGSDRVLALDERGIVTRDSGLVPGLNAGGGIFGPMDVTTPDCAAHAASRLDFADGRCLGPIIDMPKLNGQAIAFFA